MALEGGRPAGARGSAGEASRRATARLAHGRQLYSQICVACHGPDGNLIADHKLADPRSPRELGQIVHAIKEPKAPMPRLYPDLLDEHAVEDVAGYVKSGLR